MELCVAAGGRRQVADAIMATDHVSVHVVEKRDRYIMRLRCMASHRPRSVRSEKKVQCVAGVRVGIMTA